MVYGAELTKSRAYQRSKAVRGSSLAPRVLSLGAGLFGACVGLSASVVAFAVYFPSTGLAGFVADVVPLGVVHAARADSLASKARIADAQALAELERLTRRELNETPSSSSAWLRLAAVYAAMDSGLIDGRAKAALTQSYRLAPIDYTIARQRLLFVFNHWREVDRETRSAAANEMKVLWLRTTLRTRLEQLPAMTSDSAGRMAAELLVESLRNGNVSI
ncbi:hypothetical protein [Caulobacter segnis]|uniref:hypothetical protein n=1 Tax=Caulobacter segnis TaxID=88688 RepID=UPI0026EF016A|nr:hypothetical protein [Caulobacter segnis]